MKRLVLALPLAALVFALPATAGAQEQKTRGTLVSMAADSITVKVAQAEMKFSVDDKTSVTAPGGSTKTRQAAASGKSCAMLSDILKVGDAVEVSYTDAGGRHATAIRKVSTPGSGGVPSKNAQGMVTAVSASSLTIQGSSGGGGKFDQTFTIDSKTRVIARGASTKLAGGAPVTTVVGNGDSVSVAFEESGGALHATQIRVMRKATK